MSDTKNKEQTEIKDATEPPITSRSLRLSLVSCVCAFLLGEPKYGDKPADTETPQGKIIELVKQIVETDHEDGGYFVVKLALYVRCVLHIRSTANFMLAVASGLVPDCGRPVREYFTSITNLPTDVTSTISYFKWIYPGKPLPTCLRKAVIEKFQEFTAFSLAKHDQGKRDKRKARKDKARAFSAEHAQTTNKTKRKGTKTAQNKTPPPQVSLLPQVSMKTLIRTCHISEPGELVMQILGSKYPATEDAFKESKLPGEFDSSRAGKRMRLPTPETWETQLSASGNNPDVWETLIDQRKLGYMAMLRNLRNLIVTGVSEKHHEKLTAYLSNETAVMNSRQFPFRFLSSYQSIAPILVGDDLKRALDRQSNPEDKDQSTTADQEVIIANFLKTDPVTSIAGSVGDRVVQQVTDETKLVAMLKTPSAIKHKVLIIFSGDAWGNTENEQAFTQAVVKHVKSGGGLWLIGDRSGTPVHTNAVLAVLCNTAMIGMKGGGSTLSPTELFLTEENLKESKGSFMMKHPVFNNVDTVKEGKKLLYLDRASKKLQCIASSSSGDGLTFCQSGNDSAKGGRLLVDCSVDMVVQNPKYVQNSVQWLLNIAAWQRTLVADPCKSHCLPTKKLITSYQDALESAIATCVMHNLTPLRGTSLIMIDVGATLCVKMSKGNLNTGDDSTGSIQQIVDIALLMGLMLLYTCEEGELVLFSSSPDDWELTKKHLQGHMRDNMDKKDDKQATKGKTTEKRLGYIVVQRDDLPGGGNILASHQFLKDKLDQAGLLGLPSLMPGSTVTTRDNLDRMIVISNFVPSGTPRAGCRAHFSGLLIGGKPKPNWFTEIFVEDQYSEYVGEGEYPNNRETFPKAIGATFDGVAIDAGTKVTIYEKPNFEGKVVWERTGPAALSNVNFKTTGECNHLFMEAEWKEPLQTIYPPSVREWSDTNMHLWAGGSTIVESGMPIPSYVMKIPEYLQSLGLLKTDKGDGDDDDSIKDVAPAIPYIQSVADRYRDTKNPEMQLCIIDVHGMGLGTTDPRERQHRSGKYEHLDTIVSGISDGVLRFVGEASAGNDAQLNKILEIDQTKHFKRAMVD